MPTKLGQNFLINKEIVEKIVEAADLKADDLVLEIGPGKGILTEELAKRAGKVVAIEIDGNLAASLKNKFKNQKNVGIVEGDILNFKFQISNFKINSNLEFQKLFQNLKFEIRNCNYKVVANIPYYITAPIIRKFLEADCPPKEMILMVQKEVAERITAEEGKMSILAVSVQYYAKPEILFDVPRGNFEPAPEVDSSVIRITPSLLTSLPEGERESRKRFFSIVRAGFSAKRKMLVNNLANSFHLNKKEMEEKLKAAGIPPTARAQELSVEDWKKLSLSFRAERSEVEESTHRL